MLNQPLTQRGNTAMPKFTYWLILNERIPSPDDRTDMCWIKDRAELWKLQGEILGSMVGEC